MKKWLLGFAFFLLLFPTTGFAADMVSPDKVWTITFNTEMDASTFDKGIYVENEDGQRVDVSFSEKGKKVAVSADAGYGHGTYTLNVTTAVQSEAGVALADPAQQTFEVASASGGLTEKEAELATLINDYRESEGLARLPISKSLTETARTHVMDSNQYSPENGDGCNLHSWSANGDWTPVCYTSDHSQAELMWSKPSELTDYTGNGYEISVWSSAGMTPEQALSLWQSSPGHNQVLIGANGWDDLSTMGVGIDGDYAHVWFGKREDPAGQY